MRCMGKPAAPTGFGERLKKARALSKLSGAALGEGLQPDGDASRQTMSDWEAERHYPNVWQLMLICQRLNLSADYLLTGYEAPPADLAADEDALVKAYRKLKPDAKRVVLQAAGVEPSELGKVLAAAIESSGLRPSQQIVEAGTFPEPRGHRRDKVSNRNHSAE